MTTSARRDPADLVDTLGFMGNGQLWRRHLYALEQAVEERSEAARDIFDAPMYFAWLSLSSEYVAIAIRRYLYVRSDLRKREVFDWRYGDLLDAIKPDAPAAAYSAAVFAIRLRHLIVHKGFPNPHQAPLQKARTTGVGNLYDAAAVEAVRQEVGDPANFDTLKARIACITNWLQTTAGPLEAKW